MYSNLFVSLEVASLILLVADDRGHYFCERHQTNRFSNNRYRPTGAYDRSLIVLSGPERVCVSHGVVGCLIRRNIIVILLSVELMLNATNINFVAFSEYFHRVAGQVFVFSP